MEAGATRKATNNALGRVGCEWRGCEQRARRVVASGVIARATRVEHEGGTRQCWSGLFGASFDGQSTEVCGRPSCLGPDFSEV